MIVCLIVDQLRHRLSDQNLGLAVSDAALAFIATDGFDPVFGARPLKRYVQHALESRIGRAIVSCDANSGDTIVVSEAGGELKVEVRHPELDVRGAA